MSAEETKNDLGAAAPKNFDFRPQPSGIFQTYTNYIAVTWTLYDLRLRIAELVPTANNPSGERKDFVAEERAGVTMAWGEAKVLRDMLIDAVEKYEAANGEIKPLSLPKSGI